MKIEKIVLYNFGSYFGENIFNIAVQKSVGGRIVLIGGKNGAGKTTLFSGIKLCLYGYRAYGFQMANSQYRREVKKFFNDAARYDTETSYYVEVTLTMPNGQEDDIYVLRREWNVSSVKLGEFETFQLYKNNVELNEEEMADFENYLLNIIPPELFDMFFLDGEQIADYFLGDGGSEKVKNAFMILCGYDVFDIIEKNFKRITYGKKQQTDSSNDYLYYKDLKESLDRELAKLYTLEEEKREEIESYKVEISKIEKVYRLSGGILYEELNKKLLLIKDEERLREEKKTLLRRLANEMIPFVIVRDLLFRLDRQIEDEMDKQRMEILQDSLVRLLPDVMERVYKRLEWKDDKELTQLVMDEMEVEAKTEKVSKTENILCLSSDDNRYLRTVIAKYIGFNKADVEQAEQELKDSLRRTQQLRNEIDKSHVEGAEDYLRERQKLEERLSDALQKREELVNTIQEKQKILQESKDNLKKAERKLDEELKNRSINFLSQKSIAFLTTLQQRLYSSEIKKVENLFMIKVHQLARKSNFIDKIYIDNMFNVHIYKHQKYDCQLIARKIENLGVENYIIEYGDIHCESILTKANCTDLREFVEKYGRRKSKIEGLQEIEKSRLSKGEKQVFIMALYWALVQLSNHEVPFIIDTPFARIDTEHRANIAKNFFMDLRGQVFIFSTNEEIVGKNYAVMKPEIKAKFILENVDNFRTIVTPNIYFGEREDAIPIKDIKENAGNL